MKNKLKINYKLIIISIICLIVFLLVILGIMMIKNLLTTKEEVNNVHKYSLEEINNNITNKIQINEYNTFYTIEDITNEVFELITKGAYQDVCALMGNEIIYNKSEDEILSLLKEYNEVLSNSASVNSYYLSYVYEYSDDMYVCKVNINAKLITMLLRLNEEERTYEIVFIEKWR